LISCQSSPRISESLFTLSDIPVFTEDSPDIPDESINADIKAYPQKFSINGTPIDLPAVALGKIKDGYFSISLPEIERENFFNPRRFFIDPQGSVRIEPARAAARWIMIRLDAEGMQLLHTGHAKNWTEEKIYLVYVENPFTIRWTYYNQRQEIFISRIDAKKGWNILVMEDTEESRNCYKIAWEDFSLVYSPG
jgi:hypothetical protein